MEFISTSEAETRQIGFDLGKKLPDGSVVCFFGDLAAGKTTFIKGLTQGASEVIQEEVSSPTFVYLNIYQGNKPIYHFDLYRLNDPNQFIGLGFDEVLFDKGITCIEWAEKIESLLPKQCVRIKMSHLGENKRHIKISSEIPL